jgi:hypothetical protein
MYVSAMKPGAHTDKCFADHAKWKAAQDKKKKVKS